MAQSERTSIASNPTPTRTPLGPTNTQLLTASTPVIVNNLKSSVMTEENTDSLFLGSIRPSPASSGPGNGSLPSNQVHIKNEPDINGGFSQYGMHSSTCVITASSDLQLLIVSQSII